MSNEQQMQELMARMAEMEARAERAERALANAKKDNGPSMRSYSRADSLIDAYIEQYGAVSPDNVAVDIDAVVDDSMQRYEAHAVACGKLPRGGRESVVATANTVLPIMSKTLDAFGFESE